MAVGIGAAVIAVIGGTTAAAVTATAIGTIMAGIIGGALVGAAIGGLTAAITGGSIGKGILFGAVGGAVTGGLAGWAQGPTTALTTVSGTLEGGASGAAVGTGGGSFQIAGTNAVGSGTGAAASTSGSLVSALGKGAGDAISGSGGTLGSALVNQAGQMIQGSAMEDMKEKELAAQEKANQSRMELERELAQLNAGTSLAAAGMSAETSRENARLQYKLGREQLDETTRQFNVSNQLVEQQRQRQASTVAQAQAGRRGVLKGAPASIDQQVIQNDQQMYDQKDQQGAYA